jgi:LacI family transcriptional regulator
MKSGVTIVEVARRAGVSVGTASNVVSGRTVVSAEKMARVRDAIDQLGYVPNTMAQGLRQRRSRFVGLCVPHTTSAYFSALVDAFEENAADLGFMPVQVLSRHDPDVEYARVRTLLSHRVAGLVLVPSLAPERTLDLLRGIGMATVLVDRPWPSAPFDSVVIDNPGVTRAVGEALVKHGHRRVVLAVTHPGLVTTRQRIDALSEVLGSAGGYVALIEQGGDEADFGRRLADMLIGPEYATAVVASNSAVAFWVMTALRRHGIDVPRQVSVVCFDQPGWADLSSPEVAIVRHPTADIARLAWQLLAKRISTPSAVIQRLVLPATFEPRRSLGPVLS